MKTVILLTILFVLSELFLVLTKRSKIKTAKINKDRGSLIILWITISFSFTAGFNLSKYNGWDSTDYIIASTGFVIFLLGLVIRWSSIIVLKKRFTVNVAIGNEHILKTDGLFKYIRHPSYLGLLLIIGGLSIAMNTVIAVIAVVIPVFLALNYRIYIEEKLLTSEFGEIYIQYMSVTRKLIPWIY